MKNLNEKINSLKWLNLIVSIAIPFITCIIILSVFGIRYQTNDDATLSNIAAGAYGDTIHMVYVNVLFSVILRPLYALKMANWYVIVQLLLVVVSISVIVHILMKRLGAIQGIIVSATIMIAFAEHIFYSFQYTECSTIILTAGLLLITDNLGKIDKMTWIGIFLALMGSLIRWQSFYLVGGMSGVILLYKFFSIDRKKQKNAIITMAILFAVVFGAKFADILAYQIDDGWKNFAQYNNARTQYSDFKVYRLDSDVNSFAEIGVSDVDYEMLNNWDFYDPEHFTAEYILTLADSVPNMSFIEAFKKTARTLVDMLSGKMYDYMFWVVVVIAFLHMRPNKGVFEIIGIGIVCGILLFYLIYKGRLPSWVQMSLIWTFVIYIFYSVPDSAPEFSKNMIIPLLSFVLIIYLSRPAYSKLMVDAPNYREWSHSEQQYFDSMSDDKKNLYLLATDSINVAAGFDVWNPRTDNFYSNIVAFGGWLSQAPHRNEALQKYGLTRPIVDCVDKSNVYLDYHNIDLVKRYAQKELGVEVFVIESEKNPFTPYQLVTEKKEA